MNILTLHNFYRQPGGEDYVFRAEAEMLESHGHTVRRHAVRNDAITSGWLTGMEATWNHHSYRNVQELIRANRPDVAHFHNTFPVLSPSAYYAARSEGIPVVQKLSNFRLLCPGANFVRNGKVCEECSQKKSLLPSLVHACYRSSRPATAAVVTMLVTHRRAGTWQRLVDVYVAPSEFVRRKIIDGGLPQDRVIVNPHFIAQDPGAGSGSGGYALFVGRLSEEKGIAALAQAWTALADIPLRVVGDGPLNQTTWPAGVTWLGHQSPERVFELMRDARVLVVPSICFEIGPITVIEAFACGTPVIASDLGTMAERVQHMRTGLLFRAGDAEDLAAKVRWAWDHPQALQSMRVEARREYEQKYTAERGYKMLMDVYDVAIENARRRQRDANGQSA